MKKKERRKKLCKEGDRERQRAVREREEERKIGGREKRGREYVCV